MKKIRKTITPFCEATRNITVNPGWNASLWIDYSAPTLPLTEFLSRFQQGLVTVPQIQYHRAPL